jgi:hypothetical protein
MGIRRDGRGRGSEGREEGALAIWRWAVPEERERELSLLLRSQGPLYANTAQSQLIQLLATRVRSSS